MLCKLINKTVYGKTIKSMRNKIDVKVASTERDYWKWKSKPSHISQKAKSTNKNVVALISQGKYKNLLLNKKCLRH